MLLIVLFRSHDVFEWTENIINSLYGWHGDFKETDNYILLIVIVGTVFLR